MRRMMISGFVFLLLGALASVGFAWAWAAWSGDKAFDPQLAAQVRRQGWAGETLVSDGVSEMWVQSAFADAGADIVEIVFESDGSKPRKTTFIHRFGWPLRCMKAQERLPNVVKPADAREIFIGAIRMNSEVNLIMELPSGGRLVIGRSRVLPLHPLWRGLLGDAALFGGALGILAAIPFAARRASRRWRGRCGRCGYPIGASPVCSECGGKVRPRAAA